MTRIGDFKKIIEIQQVKNYILVTGKGTIVAHASEAPDTLAGLAAFLGERLSHAVDGKAGILMVSRASKENFFVFAAGRYYLGVVKHAEYDDSNVIVAVTGFLRSLSRTGSPRKQTA